MAFWLNYHHLLYFKTIAEEGSVSKAAIKLRLGQPTLSAQLKQLEDSLGVHLFERRNKKLFLTEQGKQALRYAKNIFKLGSEMHEVLKDKIEVNRPTLCIAALDSIPKSIVLNIAQKAIKESDCQLTLLEGKADELFRELSGHKIDLVLTNFIPTASQAKGLKHQIIAKNRISFFAAPKFKSLKNDFPNTLSQQPLILPTYDSKLRYDIEHWGLTNDISLNIQIESQDIALKKLMATAGIGILPATRQALVDELKNGTLIEIGKAVHVYEEIFMIKAFRQIENRIAHRIFEEIKRTGGRGAISND